MKEALESDGRIWLRRALSEMQLHKLESVLDNQVLKVGTRLNPPTALIKKMNKEVGLNNLIQPFLLEAKPVRFVSFNKSKDQNWSLPWHQDRVIAVREKENVSGFTNWSCKSGIWHCEPPEDILSNMIFARVYLDDVKRDNGCLELALGSHKFGKISAGDIDDVVERCPIEFCEAQRGDVLIVKALTVHKSGISLSHTQRRALRVDYVAKELPSPLKWKHSQI